jgi:hypothetical protein
MALPISGGSATELSATDAWLGAVAGDDLNIGANFCLVRQVADRARNSAAEVPISPAAK